jgi:ATP-dependent helicase YprA (DUF1998 family)
VLDSLLPGYLSRPHASPQKPKQLSQTAAALNKPKTTVNGLLPGTSTANTSTNFSKYTPKHSPSAVFKNISAEAIASLPLPSTALVLESQFRSLCTFYDFFQRHHIQCTFQSLQLSMNNAGMVPGVSLENLQLMKRLCPSVVHVARLLGAAEVQENRIDDWRDSAQIDAGATGATGAEGLAESGAARPPPVPVEGEGTAAGDDGDVLVSLVDPWEAKYEVGGSPPILFLEEMNAAENEINKPPPLLPGTTVATTAAGTTSASEVAEIDDDFDEFCGEDNGLTDDQVSGKKRGRGKRKLASNKPSRMSWQLRKSLVSAIFLLQERYFEGTVPPVPRIPAQQLFHQIKKRAANARRSKAGQEKQKLAATAAAETEKNTAAAAAPEVVISLLDEASDVEKSAESLLEDLLKQGRWHPLFPLENIVTLAALVEGAEILAAVVEQQPSATNKAATGSEIADVNALDALSIAHNAELRLAQVRRPPPQKRARRAPPAPPQLLKKNAPCTDTTPLSAPEFLEHLKSRPGYQDQVVHVEKLPSRLATFTTLSTAPPPPVVQALQQRNISTIYSHQAEAITHLRAGTHTVIATSTASGKSLCYILPMLEALAADPDSCAILIFPTKALAQDQKKNLQQMLVAAFGADAAQDAVEIYDGDTPMDTRDTIRDSARLLLTNPDMLHVSILPVHRQFQRILSNLKYVVVDEAHSYKGVFGCHTALVLRRLRRVCFRLYNCQPTFAVTTATVANPREHACTLLGVDEVAIVDKDGSPHGSKEFVLWNPPLKHPELASKEAEAEAVASPLVRRRAKQESERRAVRAARQERNAGIKLGGTDSAVQEDDWAAAVRAGQRDPIVKSKLAENPPQQQRQQQQKLTARQRELISQANAAISLASAGPCGVVGGGSGSTGINNSRVGALGGQRRVIRIGPQLAIATSTAGYKNVGDKNAQDEPLPTNLSSKQTASKARFGSAGVDMASARTSPIVEIASLLAECVQHGLRTIAFCKTRKLSELVIAYVREILTVTAPEMQTKVAVYRAGYSATERRQIEAALFSGALLGVAATNALELGIDIGGLDATLHLGFPGSISSLKQQAGRAGRFQQPSISIYVGWDGPLDQYFFKNPEKLFGRPVESAFVDVSNPVALQAHAACAAFEVQLDPELDSTHYFGANFAAAVAALQEKGTLGRNFLYAGIAQNPASTITLRSIDPGKFSIIDETADNKVLEEVEENKVFYQIHDGSTYFYQGRTYLCRKLDLDAKIALVRPVDVKYYTKSVDYTAVQVFGGGENAFPASTQKIKPSSASIDVAVNNSSLLPSSACVSAASVTTRWLGFVRIWRGTGEVFDSVDLFLPDVQYETEAVYLRLPPTARRRVEAAGLPFRDGVHAAAHALLNALPLFLMVNPEDVATECDNPYDTRYKPERILLYDKHPGGGIGLAKAAAPRFTELLQKALSIISNCSCTCTEGCPGCIQHTHCGEYNAVLNKEAGRLVLEAALEAEAEKYQLDKRELGLVVDSSGLIE